MKQTPKEFNLKPCPMPGCGGAAEMRHFENVEFRYWAQCTKNVLHDGPRQKTPEAAAEIWNTRENDDVIAAAQKVADAMRALDALPARDILSIRTGERQLESESRALAALLPAKETAV